jgi:acyl-coenzyme A synthetase/AMP-(fatty) acid ligase/3-hydroxymyristoyl/3-hydroxydecanoyl-(acyl carrier protein) dehydratase
MPEWMPLAELACRTADATRAVAWADGLVLTHADFLAQVDRWQRAFQASQGKSWAISLQDSFGFAAALFGAWHAGKSVVLPGDDRPATLAALRNIGCGLAGDLSDGLQPTQAGQPALVRQPLNLEEAALTVFTSGSQGQPQAIDKTLAPFWSEVEALEQAFGPILGGDERLLPITWATVSHQHIYGLLFLVLWPLAAGRPLARQRLQYPEDMIRALGAAPSVLVATPAHLKRLGDHLAWGAVRPTLGAVFSSGGPLPFEVSQEVERLTGCRPIEVLGSSETGGIAWRQATVASTPWLPFSDVRWRVDDGCLAVHSPRLPGQGWWQTSDRVEPDGEGGFRLLGRQDRIVKIEEKRVSLTAVERALLATPWVQEAKAVVVSTPIGERVGVVLVPSNQASALLTQGRRMLSVRLKEALADSLEPMAQPRRWRFVDALPVNAQGKTPEGLLRDLFARPVDGLVPMPEMPPVTWLEQGPDDALAVLDIHPGLSVFNGHFPMAPILPGVAQLDWALMLGRRCFALPEAFVRLEVLKFVRPVVPGTKLHLSLQRKAKPKEPELTTLQFRLYSQVAADDGAAEVEHASGRAVWRASEAAQDV